MRIYWSERTEQSFVLFKYSLGVISRLVPAAAPERAAPTISAHEQETFLARRNSASAGQSVCCKSRAVSWPHLKAVSFIEILGRTETMDQWAEIKQPRLETDRSSQRQRKRNQETASECFRQPARPEWQTNCPAERLEYDVAAKRSSPLRGQNKYSDKMLTIPMSCTSGKWSGGFTQSRDVCPG